MNMASSAYTLLNSYQAREHINALSEAGQQFLFIVDFKGENSIVIPVDDINSNDIIYQIGANSNESNEIVNKLEDLLKWDVFPVSEQEYQLKFEYIQQQILLGNSFLTNLTQPSKVHTNLSLSQLYRFGSAKYKLWLKDQFVVFSPETFVRIEGQTISSYPMKGTIDASIPNAEQIILNDPKEKAEHATIVDLIRNDLSLVAENVEVKRYRYVEKLTTNKQDLFQVSSEISGQLPLDFHKNLGDILFALLPAGSICGAPKAKTLEIIEHAENYDRGFYTGVCGYFDGKNLDSAVMIRFIEQDGDSLVFKSGGGITAQSDMKKEYEELIQKIYVPIS